MSMKLCRFTHRNASEPHYGIIEDGFVRPLSDEDVFDGRRQTDSAQIPLAEIKLLPPVTPSKIVCVGRNYKEHAAELGNTLPPEPLLFLKAPSAIIGSGEAIILPPESVQVEHEGEIGVVIGRIAARLGESDDPLNYVLGYTCVNDVTARDLQKKDVQFTRGKGFDTFCPVGPLVTDEVDPWAGIELQTRLNGEPKQNGNTRDFIFGLDVVIPYITQIMTLLPGGLIATGTPSGGGTMKGGE